MPKITAFPTLQRSYQGGNQILLNTSNPIFIRDNGIEYGAQNILGNIIDTANLLPLTLLGNSSSTALPYLINGEQILGDTAVTIAGGNTIDFGVDLIAAGLAVAGVNANGNLSFVNIKNTNISPTDEGSYIVVAVANGAATNSVAIVVEALTTLPPSFTSTSGTAACFNSTSVLGAAILPNVGSYGNPGDGNLNNVNYSRYQVSHINTAGGFSNVMNVENRADLGDPITPPSYAVLYANNNPDVSLGYSADVPCIRTNQTGDYPEIQLGGLSSDPTHTAGLTNGGFWYDTVEERLKYDDNSAIARFISGERKMTQFGTRNESVVSYAAGTPINPDVRYGLHFVIGTGHTTITATPSIVTTNLEFGDIIVLAGGDNGDGNTLTLQDESNLPGSLLRLSGGSDFTLGSDEYIVLQWVSTATGRFKELFRSSKFYASAYDTTSQSVATAGTFQGMNFSNNIGLDGWTHTAGTSIFTCERAGIYNINTDYVAFKSGGPNSLLEVIFVKNGTEIAGSASTLGITTNNQFMKGSATLQTTFAYGDTLEVQFTANTTNPTLTPTVNYATTGVSARINIGQI